jgi:hypothetical protein
MRRVSSNSGNAEMAPGRQAPAKGRADVTVRKRPQPGRETIISNREVPLGKTEGSEGLETDDRIA